MTEIIVNSPKHGTHVVLIDDDDMCKLEGLAIFVWTTQRHHTFYAMTTLHKKSVRIHRLILGVTDPKVLVDHINGNGLDNRKSNLRITSASGNNMNARKRKSARTSKFKGVHRDSASGKWIAQIQINTQKKSLGRYLTEPEAALAYNQAAIKHHGEFAVLNEITNDQED